MTASNLIDLDYIAETAATLYEDGEDFSALLAMMDDNERADFTAYCDDINRKNARIAYSAPAANTVGINCPSETEGFESAILARQGY